mgnify:CR=1 FL=1
MRAVIQRVKHAQVSVDGHVVGEIQQGLLVLLGITHTDEQEDVDWLARKIVGLRIFSDEEAKMNFSLIDVGGKLLVISQFTLFAKTKKGNRPSYIDAAKPEIAIPVYEAFVHQVNTLTGIECATGTFGADMQVEMLNDGPVTIIIDSKNKDL